ncbi:MAG: hypothetical protein NTY19_03965 [Planctomycetota bacterium]|nr:hypothetical protein [Planctomycetota bacterium]
MRRLQRCLKWAAIVVTTGLLSLLVLNAVLAWNAARRMDQRLAALRAAGKPVTLADLQPQPVPENRDAAALVCTIRPRLQAWEDEFDHAFPDRNDRPEPESARGDRLTEKQVQTLQPLWDRYADLLPTLQQAASCPEYRSQVDFNTSAFRFLMNNDEQRALPFSACKYLALRIDLLMHQGRRDESLRTCVIMFRLAMLIEREPTIASYHASLVWRRRAAFQANRILQAGSVSSELRQELDSELARHDTLEGFIGALRSERALGLDMYQAMCTGEVDDKVGGADRSMLQSVARWILPLIRWRHRNAACDYLDMMEHVLAFGAVPCYEVRSQARPSRNWYKESDDLTSQTVFEVYVARKLLDVTRAEMRCLRVLNALQRRPAEAGAETASLAELDLPADATVDPFSGNPLLVKKTNHGWTIYSVGPDLEDDGGEIVSSAVPRDCGFGPPGDESRSGESPPSSATLSSPVGSRH